MQDEPRIKLQKVRCNFTNFLEDSLGLHKIFEKFSQNNFLLEFHGRINIEFGTKRDNFQGKQMTIHLGKNQNNFTNKRTFLPVLAVMNRKFITNLVGRIWGSNLSQNSIHTMTNVW